MSDNKFEIHYGSATNYDDAFLEQCRQDPCVLTKIEDDRCDIYLVVTEQEIRDGRTGLPHFLDTREDSSNMTLIADPGNPGAPWKRVYWIPKYITQEIIRYLDEK